MAQVENDRNRVLDFVVYFHQFKSTKVAASASFFHFHVSQQLSENRSMTSI